MMPTTRRLADRLPIPTIGLNEMPLYGDPSQIATIRAALRELQKVPSRAAKRVEQYLNDRLQEMFDRGVDPYGNAWAPLLPSTVQRKKGDARILQRSDEMRGDTYARAASKSGINIHVGGAGYWHQTGTAHMVARRILPQFGLPAKWRADIKRIVEEEIRKAKR